ncbi:uncharacterized protein K489DRAFT_62955 [Dissoconium aciculare CBS 342.82]|uniref:Uncharacterized protein n=1 Tax=Dissoconium aciculare CBS 342.82 TaxID=1314786 RepID=A0A6J3LW21_9PEZI|nr:uncharacterized protein K489DRAFT_62955 [Dissoconium aciculare CBS 342.82]KAF1819970.1 hypothetical protein K489DRAFT_62955 [Dissoconium aciculare CBS 342.82]
MDGFGFRNSIRLDIARGRCGSCHDYVRVCAPHFLFLKKQPGKAQSAVEVLLHADFQALQQSVHDGCQLYPCWSLALLNGSAPPAMLRRIQECESPEFATSLITISQSRIKPGVVKVAEIHYFRIFNPEMKAPMRNSWYLWDQGQEMRCNGFWKDCSHVTRIANFALASDLLK